MYRLQYFYSNYTAVTVNKFVYVMNLASFDDLTGRSSKVWFTFLSLLKHLLRWLSTEKTCEPYPTDDHQLQET